MLSLITVWRCHWFFQVFKQQHSQIERETIVTSQLVMLVKSIASSVGENGPTEIRIQIEHQIRKGCVCLSTPFFSFVQPTLSVPSCGSFVSGSHVSLISCFTNLDFFLGNSDIPTIPWLCLSHVLLVGRLQLQPRGPDAHRRASTLILTSSLCRTTDPGGEEGSKNRQGGILCVII